MSLPPSPSRSFYTTTRSTKDIARIRGTLGDTVYLIESFNESLNQTAKDNRLQRDQVSGLIGSWREEIDTVRQSTDATARSMDTLENTTRQTNERLHAIESNIIRLQTTQEDLQKTLSGQVDQLQMISTALQVIASRPSPAPASSPAPMHGDTGSFSSTLPPVHVHIPMDTICDKLGSQLERLYAHPSSVFPSTFPMPSPTISSHDQAFPTTVVRSLKRPNPRDDPPVCASASVLQPEFINNKRIRGTSAEAGIDVESGEDVDLVPSNSPPQTEISSRTMVDIPVPVDVKPFLGQPPVYTNTDVDNDVDVDVVPPSDDEAEPEVQDEIEVEESMGQSDGVSQSLTAPSVYPINRAGSGSSRSSRSQQQHHQSNVKEETIETTMTRDNVFIEKRKESRDTRPNKRTLLQPLSSSTDTAHADLHPSETEDEGEGDEEELELEFDV